MQNALETAGNAPFGEKAQAAAFSALTTIYYVWRIIKMTRQTENMTRGIGVGMAIGAVAGIAGTWLMSNNKNQLKRKARHAGDALSDLVDNVSCMFKQ